LISNRKELAKSFSASYLRCKP